MRVRLLTCTKTVTSPDDRVAFLVHCTVSVVFQHYRSRCRWWSTAVRAGLNINSTIHSLVCAVMPCAKCVWKWSARHAPHETGCWIMEQRLIATVPVRMFAAELVCIVTRACTCTRALLEVWPRGFLVCACTTRDISCVNNTISPWTVHIRYSSVQLARGFPRSKSMQHWAIDWICVGKTCQLVTVACGSGKPETRPRHPNERRTPKSVAEDKRIKGHWRSSSYVLSSGEDATASWQWRRWVFCSTAQTVLQLRAYQ